MLASGRRNPSTTVNPHRSGTQAPPIASSAEADWREQHDQRAVPWLSPAVYAGDAIAVLGGVAGPRLADAVDEDRPHPLPLAHSPVRAGEQLGLTQLRDRILASGWVNPISVTQIEAPGWRSRTSSPACLT
jgi:hypothetical protein